ncbi:MAG: lipoyl synthase [Lentisphaeria bacterium]|nr:lipoyl synthase [Lentisphaeria bacterium]
MPDNAAKPKRLPPWFNVSFKGKKERGEVRRILRELNLHSVCESAHCPNICDCWRKKTATFMIMGPHCTRNCRFCAVTHQPPSPLDPGEPARVAEAADRLGLKHVVVTSVTRDDLADGGADHFVRTIQAIKLRLPAVSIEVLVPDFRGDLDQVSRVADTAPTVFNHNIETCRRLTSRLRDHASYDRSLKILTHAARNWPDPLIVKSGFMLGVGETDDEIRDTLMDLKHAGVTSVTIGQYLAPSEAHWPVDRFVSPEAFAAWKTFCVEGLGFAHVACGPQVRSSYHADDHI